MYVCMCMCVYICMCVCVCVCAYIHMCVRICIYIESVPTNRLTVLFLGATSSRRAKTERRAGWRRASTPGFRVNFVC